MREQILWVKGPAVLTLEFARLRIKKTSSLHEKRLLAEAIEPVPSCRQTNRGSFKNDVKLATLLPWYHIVFKFLEIIFDFRGIDMRKFFESIFGIPTRNREAWSRTKLANQEAS